MLKFKPTLLLLFCLFAINIQAQDDVIEAIVSDNIGGLSKLLKFEIIDDCIDIDGKEITYLSAAVKMGSYDAVSFLISAGANVDIICIDKTPLMYAVKYGQMKILNKLLEAGADPNIKNGERTLMDYAEKYEQEEIAEYIKTKFIKG